MDKENKKDEPTPVLINFLKDKIVKSPRIFVIKKQVIKGEGSTLIEYYLFGLIPIFRSISFFDQYQL